MTGRGDHGDDDFNDAFEPERDDRGGAGGGDSGGAGEEELLDQAWQQSHGGGGGLRWLLVLLVIPVVALVVLQLRPDAPPSASPTPSATSTPRTRAHSTSPTPGPDDTGQQARSGRRTAAATPAGPGPVVKNLGHSVLGVSAGWELFVRGADGVARVQLAKGRVTTTKVRDLGDESPVNFFVTSAGAFALADSETGGFEVLDGHRAKRLAATDVLSGTFGAILPGPDPGHVWALAENNDGERAVLLDSRLHRAGPERPLPDNASRGPFMGGTSDGAGTLLATTPGGTYAIEKGGVQRITPGEVVGAGPTRWLVVECDDMNRCTHSVINRETGARRSLQLRVPQEMQGFGPVGRISPDGSMMASLEIASQAPTIVLTDLSSGARHQVGHVNLQSFGSMSTGTFAWSPDGRWLFYAADTGELMAVNAETRKSTVLDLGLDSPKQVAVRPGP